MNTEQPQLEVAYVPVADLVPYAGNAKRHPDEQVGQIARSIEEFGNCDPIAVWHDNDGRAVIVEGHGRVLALNRLGVETTPVISLDHLSDAQRRAYAHVHNQTTLNSGFDLETLETEFAELPEFDFSEFGFELNDDYSLEKGDDDLDDVKSDVVIVVEVDSDEIEGVFERLTAEGYQCRLLTL